MSRSQDTVIDDDEEACPLCIEEFDLSDKNFKPCPCGYQICQFCFNSLKTTYEKSTCPNCRRPYDESTIQYKIPTAEELKLDQLNKNKKQAAAKRKETEKREVENSSRRNLAGVRVKQQNLVYIIGLEPTKKDEATLLDTLRGKDYFGQYGPIEKIVVSKAKAGAINQGIGVYVTFKHKEDAALCIECVDGSQNGDKTLRAQYGTTKYCSAFLRGETCTNKNCSFLHETGEDGQNTSLQNEPIETKTVKPLHPRPLPISQPSMTSQVMVRQNSKDETISRTGSTDGSALPPTAGWANTPVMRTRRASQARSTPSPQLPNTIPVQLKSDPPKAETTILPPKRALTPDKITSPVVEATPPKQVNKPEDPMAAIFESVRRSVLSGTCRFIYDDSWMSAENREKAATMPPMYDRYGGAKRRLMADKEAEERARESEARLKLQEQAMSTAEEALDEGNMAAGSLALGGEPEDNSRRISARAVIGRPSQPGSATNFGDQFPGRSITPQQRQANLPITTGVQQAPGLPQPPTQNTAFELSDFDRRGPQFSQAQYDQISNHQRHGSRYFNSDSKSRGNRFQGQQQQFYSSGIQGPPPGLPTAGTPPISGGGMFAHGQGFTSGGFGTAKDANTDILRGRGGTNVGNDISKRGGVEHLADPSILSARIHQGGTTGQGLFGGNQVAEEEFPPLPAKVEFPSVNHSRVSSYQSFGTHTHRSGTPIIPPGLESLHAHPNPSLVLEGKDRLSVTKLSANTTTAPISPAVPVLPIGSGTGTPKFKLPREAARCAEVEKEEVAKVEHQPKNEISETPILKSPPQILEQEERSNSLAPKAAIITEPKVEQQLEKAEAQVTRKGKISRPTKIEIPKAGLIDHSKPSAHVPLPSMPDPVTVRTPDATFSRPTTPATNFSDAKRPRTLRLTTEMIQKAQKHDTVAPASAATERSSAFQSLTQVRQSSRHPSVSTSRPSTPAASDFLVSQEVSRAGSPPPSVVGSAPTRIKTKNQLKKERKEKARKATEPTETPITPNANVTTTSATDVVAPIVARQKKQRKQKVVSSVEESKNPVNRTKSDKAHQISKDEYPAKVQEKPVESLEEEGSYTPSVDGGNVQDIEPKPVYTLRDIYNEAAKSTATNSLQKVLQERVSPMSKLLAEMVSSGDLSKDHPWFTPHMFNSPAYKLPNDSRRGQEYLDGNGYSTNDAFGYVYLPQKEKRALYQGHAVSVADSGDRKNDLLRRCLITPNGWVMRHLSAEESERVLELDERRSLYAEEFGEIGAMNGLGILEQDDFINLGGGFEELARFGDRHGVCWVVGDEQQADEEYADMEERDIEDGLSDATDEDLGIDLSKIDDLIPAEWDVNDTDASILPPNTLPPIQGQYGRTVNLRAMDSEALQKRVQEKHKEADGSRKDMEKAEKILNKKAKDLARWRDSVFKS